MATFGLVAGAGAFPLTIARAARAEGHRVAAVALRGLSDPGLAGVAHECAHFFLGEFKALFAFLRGANAREVLMAGKVPRTLLFDASATRPDALARSMLSELREDSDDAIMQLVARAIEAQGFLLREQLAFTPELRAPCGALGRAQPSAHAKRDLAFGWPRARAHAASGEGQSIVVGARRVFARESIAHTDDAIARGCHAANKAGVPARVLKVKRPDQDPRFDLPTVGPETIRAMARGGADVLAVEAGVTVVLERETLVREADAAGIAVLGVDDASIRALAKEIGANVDDEVGAAAEAKA